MEDYLSININDEIYPVKLRNIKNKPKNLFIRGNLNLLDKKSIAIVGSRNCTDYGFRQAYEFSKELSKRGICIISGLAEGIDTSAHLGAMHQAGKTIVVLGSGLNMISPEENENLSFSIVKNGGMIITEYNLYEKPESVNFPRRNRIMTGLSDGVLIIEARKKSGTLISARLAKEQSKKIFCLPGNLSSKTSYGTNELIKNGAKLVTSVNDILQEMEQEEEQDIYKVKKEYRKVYDILTFTPMHINEICKKAKSSIAEVNQIITMLEIEGLVKKLPNNEFIKR